MKKNIGFLALALLVAGQTSYGAVVYNEGTSGDLSGNLAAPTAIASINGDNTVIGGVGNNGNTGATNGSDADYFSLVVPAGRSLTSITVDSYLFSGGNPGSSFFGYVAGTGFTGQGGGDVDAFQLFNAGTGNLISSSLPLGPGTYSFWIQETTPTTVNYQLTFTQVPEPATAGMLALGSLVFVGMRKRNR